MVSVTISAVAPGEISGGWFTSLHLCGMAGIGGVNGMDNTDGMKWTV
jgi:hypothetical protein